MAMAETSAGDKKNGALRAPGLDPNHSFRTGHQQVQLLGLSPIHLFADPFQPR
jgi:hypothetical protein